MAQAEDPSLDFAQQVLPVLADRCFPCHGPDPQSRQADLRLDRAAAAHDSGVLEWSEGEPGELLRRVFAERARDRMPPPGSGLALSEEERQLLRRWVQGGAPYAEHWAFVPLPDAVEVPRCAEDDWSREPLDRFVLAALRQRGLAPSAPASRERWLRRVTFDLTGLPPDPAAIRGFLEDGDPEAFERVVDRLLASPAFGERMAVPWLDLARYADSYGYQSDQLCPTWPYRDWVVEAFNSGLPYDEFLTQQLAGDRLEERRRATILATAFQRLHRMTNEGGSIEAEWRAESVADRVNTFGTAFLGLTLECARCHDHKFDPITQREYYSLSAYFNSIDEWGMYNDSARVPTPTLLLPTDAERARLAEVEAAIEAAEKACATVAAGQDQRLQEWLASSPPAVIPGCTGDYPLDSVGPEGALENLVRPEVPGRTASANVLVPGRRGQALQCSGDDPVSFPGVCGGLHPHEPFSVSSWIWLPSELEEAVIFHRSGGTDVGYHGVELSMREGRLFFAMMRFWPGNAWAVGSLQQLPRERWVHVVAVHEARFGADGLRLYVDGVPDRVVLRDAMTKDPGQGGEGLTFGERFRDWGLKGARLDDVRAFDRALSPVEAADLFDGVALTRALETTDLEALTPYFAAAFDAPWQEAQAALRDLRWQRMQLMTAFLEVPVMEELPEPRPAHVLARGAYDAPRTAETRVERRTPAVLPVAAAVPDRLALARWLTDPRHPLTARVEVNRLWELLFGRGLVETTENFGAQGSPPSHPELLDWLARDLIEHDWDRKHWLRRVVLSATYRQDSSQDSATRARDPANVWLARGPAQRLTAEMLRDTALAASGLLEPRLGGPPVSPYQPADLWRESNSMSPAYRQSVGRDLYRRSLYTVWKRTAPMPSMVAFDAPMREVCVARRQPTSTPSQALVLLNDVQFVEAARVLAARAMHLHESLEDRIQEVFLRLAGRRAGVEELGLLVALHDRQRHDFAGSVERARAFLSSGASPQEDTLDPLAHAALTVVVQAVLNLDATLWKR